MEKLILLMNIKASTVKQIMNWDIGGWVGITQSFISTVIIF
jgi:hypothetical protein